ncbi:hypothetical protein BD414DRAFT_478204 [Trametes punicea]|nr:hypothetical protein BD414DRAFT_478204 [Trametes punicea]
MLPLADFNFIACALATVSAAVGYRVSRGRTRSANGPSTQAERLARESRFGFLKYYRRNSTTNTRSASVAVTESEGTDASVSECSTPQAAEQVNCLDESGEDCLKRKRSLSMDSNVASSKPPSKRYKTPEPKHTPVTVEEILASRTPLNATQAPTDTANGRDEPAAGPSEFAAEPATEKCPGRNPIHQFEPSSSTTPASPPVPQVPSWLAASAIVPVKPSTAFSAFSGTASAFASVSCTTSQPRSVWSASSSDATATARATASDPLAAMSYSTSTQTIVTGEEDESVLSEVKGAKVFIKRGGRDFCEGILGNVKLLRHKDTGHERILFRREPVMKVSMNVRLGRLVRCSFDEAQGVLRVALKEPVEESQQEQIVVYAMKVRLSRDVLEQIDPNWLHCQRGKAVEGDFTDFAESVMAASRLYGQVPT